MKNFGNKTGLTLMELLIVIAILTVLVSIVLMATGRNRTSAEEDLTESMLALLDSALQEYEDFKGYFPTQTDRDILTEEVLITHSEILYGELNSIPDSRRLLEKVDASMIRDTDGNSNMEICDRWGTPLNYIYNPNDPAFDVFPLIVSAGPDKTFGTADDIKNRK